MRVSIAILAVGAGLCAGCATPRSTRLTAEDLGGLASEIAGKFARSELIATRDESSRPMVITLSRMENLTDDLLPHRELWYVSTKVRDDAGLVEFGRRKAFSLVVPAEQLTQDAGVRDRESRGATGERFASQRAPTHTLDSTLRSSARSSASAVTPTLGPSSEYARSDVYIAEFRLTNLASGEVEWTETAIIKRQAFGRSFD